MEEAAKSRLANVRQTCAAAFRFAGRSPRTELIGYGLAAFLLSFPVSLGTSLTLPYETHLLIGNALTLLLAVPVPALIVRRLHDQGRSGVWVWLAIYSFAVWLVRTGVSMAAGPDGRLAFDRFTWVADWLVIPANVAMLVLLLLPGTIGPNRYGPDPRGREATPPSA